MLLKSLALKIYMGLPVFAQRKIVRILYPGYVVAAKVFITAPDGKFLAVKTTYADDWDIPSGHCDPGESPNDAASRELWEETGLKIDNMQQCGVIFNPALKSVQVLFTHKLNKIPTTSRDNLEISHVVHCLLKNFEVLLLFQHSICYNQIFSQFFLDLVYQE